MLLNLSQNRLEKALSGTLFTDEEESLMKHYMKLAFEECEPHKVSCKLSPDTFLTIVFSAGIDSWVDWFVSGGGGGGGGGGEDPSPRD